VSVCPFFEDTNLLTDASFGSTQAGHQPGACFRNKLRRFLLCVACQYFYYSWGQHMIEDALNSLYTYVHVPKLFSAAMNTEPGSIGVKVLLPHKRVPRNTYHLQRRTATRRQILRDALRQGRAEWPNHLHHALLFPEARALATQPPMDNATSTYTRRMCRRRSQLRSVHSGPQLKSDACEVLPGETERMS
jgi:hypothetical protein